MISLVCTLLGLWWWGIYGAVLGFGAGLLSNWWLSWNEIASRFTITITSTLMIKNTLLCLSLGSGLWYLKPWLGFVEAGR